MFTQPRLSATALAVLLTSMAAHAADDPVVRAECHSGDRQAVVSLAASGEGVVEGGQGAAAYRCQLELEAVEGPPFGENASGMLILETSKQGCEPAAAKDIVQLEVFVHIADPELPSREALAVIERRVAMFECQVPVLDLDALGVLHDRLEANKQAGGS